MKISLHFSPFVILIIIRHVVGVSKGIHILFETRQNPSETFVFYSSVTDCKVETYCALKVSFSQSFAALKKFRRNDEKFADTPEDFIENDTDDFVTGPKITASKTFRSGNTDCFSTHVS